MKKILLLLLSLSTLLFANIGQISALSGEVSVERGSQSIAANRGFVLQEKDILNTAANSRAQVVFSDDTVVTVGQNAILDIAEFVYDMQNPENSKADIGFMEGTFRAVTGSVGSVAPERFNLKTKSASIGIRGTIILGDQTRIAVTEGEIAVTAQGVTQIVGAGMMTMTPEGQPPSAPEPLDEGFVQSVEGETLFDEDEITPLATSQEDEAQEQEAQTQEEGTDEALLEEDGLQEWAEEAVEDEVVEPPVALLPTLDEVIDETNEDSVAEAIDEIASTPADFSFEGLYQLVDPQEPHFDSGEITIKNIQSSGNSYTGTAVINGEEYATYDFNLNDDLYWGYWEDENLPSGIEAPWIAGIEYAGDLPENPTTFKGNVRGTVTDSGTAVSQILMNSNNKFEMTIEFGNPHSIYGIIEFDDDFGNEWRTSFSDSEAGENNYFSTANIEDTSSNLTIHSGTLQGKVFGSDSVKAVGGGFNISGEIPSTNSYNAQGIFKGVKQ